MSEKWYCILGTRSDCFRKSSGLKQQLAGLVAQYADGLALVCGITLCYALRALVLIAYYTHHCISEPFVVS